jgi:hypothetical protein
MGNGAVGTGTLLKAQKSPTSLDLESILSRTSQARVAVFEDLRLDLSLLYWELAAKCSRPRSWLTLPSRESEIDWEAN